MFSEVNDCSEIQYSILNIHPLLTYCLMVRKELLTYWLVTLYVAGLGCVPFGVVYIKIRSSDPRSFRQGIELQRSQWIHSDRGFFSFFNASWSQWTWITPKELTLTIIVFPHNLGDFVQMSWGLTHWLLLDILAIFSPEMDKITFNLLKNTFFPLVLCLWHFYSGMCRNQTLEFWGEKVT